MQISLLTDAPKHNLALMKLSTHFKENGDSVLLNMPLFPADYRLASILFEKNTKLFSADVFGGPAFPNSIIPPTDEMNMPDYNLYPHNDFSLGYTFRPCFRGCCFCKVTKMKHPNTDHHSIWEFHDSKFKKICLLNNNTFMDINWRETFEEIRDANLTVIDENGYDLRLIDEEKALALKNTKFEGKIHFAWDRMQDGSEIISGLKTIKKAKLQNIHIYVLIGYDTTEEEDLYRCQKIIDFGYDPYIMPFNASKKEKRFKRFIDTFMWRKYKTIKEAWENYCG